MERMDDILGHMAANHKQEYEQRSPYAEQRPNTYISEQSQAPRRRPLPEQRGIQGQPDSYNIGSPQPSPRSQQLRGQNTRPTPQHYVREEPAPRQYGAPAQPRSPLSPQRLADYGASTYRQFDYEEEQEALHTPSTYPTQHHYYASDTTLPAIEADVLEEGWPVREEESELDDQDIFYDDWEREPQRPTYVRPGQHGTAAPPNSYTARSYEISSLPPQVQQQRSNHNLRNVRPATQPPALPEPRMPEARTSGPALPERNIPPARSAEPRTPAPRNVEYRTPETRIPEPRLPEPRQPEIAQPRRTTQPLNPASVNGLNRTRQPVPAEPRNRLHPPRPSMLQDPIHVQPNPPTEPSFVPPGTKQVCPKCKGAGFLRANVLCGHPNFGKPIACVCKEQERKEKRRQQLREMSNLDAFQDSSFHSFNARIPGVREAFESAYRYAQSPNGWLVLIGVNGCGKTHLAAAIANKCLEDGAVVLFAVVPDLLDHLRAAFAPTATELYDQLFAKMREAEVLVLDDLGAQQSSPWANEKLFQLLNYRYNMGMPTVITANPKGLQGIDERIRSRLSDVNLAVSVNMNQARDYRPNHPRRDHL